MYCVSNPVPIHRLREFSNRLCAEAYGTQSYCQCLGYDRLCALAYLLQQPGDSTYKAVHRAVDAVRTSSYCRGFQTGWDGRDKKEFTDPCYHAGWELGRKARRMFVWSQHRPDSAAGR